MGTVPRTQKKKHHDKSHASSAGHRPLAAQRQQPRAVANVPLGDAALLRDSQRLTEYSSRSGMLAAIDAAVSGPP